MTEATVRRILAMEPFEPITIRMAGRTSHDISRPESVTIPPGGGVLHIHEGGRWAEPSRSITSPASKPSPAR